MNVIKRVSSVIVCMLLFFSCVKEGNTIYIEIDEDDEDRDMVFFVSKKGSLGDIGYVDALYRGVVQGANTCNLMLSLVELPADTLKTISTLEYLLNYMQTEKQDRNALVVIANDNLEPLLHQYESILTKAPNVDFLLCESSDTTLPIYTLRIPQYGVYYQAGRLVCECLADADSILIVSANPSESNIADMSKGFMQAVKDCGSSVYVENVFLSATAGGYDQADYVYRQSYEIDERFDMVIPLCGGSAQGFYRYNRENPESFYTIGVDTDMQLYSPRVPFSVVKKLDSVMSGWIETWWEDEPQAMHQEFGLKAGGTELVIADAFKDQIGERAEKFYQMAVEKEENYENQ